MRHDPDQHHRRSIRLAGYDYAQFGAYFLTLCAYNRQCTFGEIAGDSVQLNAWGEIVREEWLRTAAMRHDVTLDEFIIMPNHMHMVVLLAGQGDHNGRMQFAPTDPARGDDAGRMQFAPTQRAGDARIRGTATRAIGSIVQGFKGAVTRRINQLRASSEPPVWQRNYYEHVVRDEKTLNAVREYILNNPARWAEDPDNPAHRPTS
jgi:REP element-mobilizing transposase RayT